jgi:hypothetical protein
LKDVGQVQCLVVGIEMLAPSAANMEYEFTTYRGERIQRKGALILFSSSSIVGPSLKI